MELFGRTYGSPVVLAPTGSNKAFHEDGDLAVSRAARRTNNLQILSTVATASIEQAIEARGRPVWFQLYPTNKWAVAEALAKRAEKAGAETIVVTVDVLARQNWETYVRLWRTDKRNCAECHGLGLASFVKRKPNFDGLDLSGIEFDGRHQPHLDVHQAPARHREDQARAEGPDDRRRRDPRRRQRARRHHRLQPWRP